MTAATDLGCAPAGDYAATVAGEVDWLVVAAGGDGADILPGPADPFFGPLLDYAAEDRYLTRTSRWPAPIRLLGVTGLRAGGRGHRRLGALTSADGKGVDAERY